MTVEDQIASPCIKHCILNKHNICEGCGRSMNEIAEWSRMNQWERRAIMQRIQGDSPAQLKRSSAQQQDDFNS